MRFLFRLLFAVPRFILSILGRLFLSILKVFIIIAIIIFGLYYFANHSTSPVANQLSNIFSDISLYFDQGTLRNNKSIEKQIKLETTDKHNSAHQSKWKTNKATIYIETKNPVLRSAYENAINDWNQAKVFNFKIIQTTKKANIIAKDFSDSSIDSAGLADSTINHLTNRITHVDVYLNSYYLLNPDFGYTDQQIINTACHELGHAIGLKHDDNHDSVMQSKGSRFGIHPIDIETVKHLYGIN